MDLSRTKEVYKIQRPDGLFSTGGYKPHFSKTGKMWKRLGDLTQHLNIVRSTAYNNNVYGECNILKYLLVAEIIQSTPIGKQIEGIKERECKKQMASWQMAEKRRKRERQDQYETLKREFE